MNRLTTMTWLLASVSMLVLLTAHAQNFNRGSYGTSSYYNNNGRYNGGYNNYNNGRYYTSGYQQQQRNPYWNYFNRNNNGGGYNYPGTYNYYYRQNFQAIDPLQRGNTGSRNFGGSTTKAGSCPPVGRDMVGICVEQCSSDSSCPGTQKCCRNGCGHTCSRPANTGSSFGFNTIFK